MCSTLGTRKACLPDRQGAGQRRHVVYQTGGRPGIDRGKGQLVMQVHQLDPWSSGNLPLHRRFPSSLSPVQVDPRFAFNTGEHLAVICHSSQSALQRHECAFSSSAPPYLRMKAAERGPLLSPLAVLGCRSTGAAWPEPGSTIQRHGRASRAHFVADTRQLGGNTGCQGP